MHQAVRHDLRLDPPGALQASLNWADLGSTSRHPEVYRCVLICDSDYIGSQPTEYYGMYKATAGL
jgi:hypothetical protein